MDAAIFKQDIVRKNALIEAFIQYAPLDFAEFPREIPPAKLTAYKEAFYDLYRQKLTEKVADFQPVLLKAEGIEMWRQLHEALREFNAQLARERTDAKRSAIKTI